MTHVTCPSCELRFTRAAATTIRRCPFCGGGLATQDAATTVGYQLVEPRVSLTDATPPPPSDERGPHSL